LLDCTSVVCSEDSEFADFASSLSELYSGKLDFSFVSKISCSKALLLVSFFNSTISFLILLISCYKSEIVINLVLGLENLSKVSSRYIFDMEGVFSFLVMSFLIF
jgi:hypothetical protein